MYKRIVVPLDGSDVAEIAIPQAKDLARHYGARLFIVRVAPLPRAIASPVSMHGTGINPPFGVIAENENERTGHHEQTYVDGMVRTLRAEGFEAEGMVLTGTPGATIVSVLDSGDMLVMTSHGRTGVQRLFMGSVASDVIKRAQVPVLVMRADTAQ